MTTVLVWFIVQDEDHSYQTRKVRTRMKLGCPAKIYIREIVSFPDFQVITYKEESVEHTLYMHCFTDAFYRASYASVVYAVVMCLSVRLSQVGVLQWWLNLGSHKQCHTIAHEL